MLEEINIKNYIFKTSVGEVIMRKYTAIILFIFLMISFAACGGGGGGGDSAPAPDSQINGYNVNLKTLGVSQGNLSPVFSPDTTAYNLEVHDTTSSVVFLPETADSSGKIKVNGTDAASGSGLSINISGSVSVVKVTVTAPDNTTTKTYTISVNRVSTSSNANLAGLMMSEGTLSSSFNPDTTAYNVDVANSVDKIKVLPVSAGINSTVKVNGVAVDSDDESQSIDLVKGITYITVTVTAENGTVKSYVIAVNRYDSATNANLAGLTLSAGVLSGGFSPDTTSYTAFVLYATSAITIRATAAWSKSVIKVRYGAQEESVVSGHSSSLIPLSEGVNSIDVIVTAEDNSTKSYTVKVWRTEADTNADLASLTISAGSLSPAFSVNTLGYNVSVPYVTDSLTVTPTTSVSTSVVTVNNVILGSGNASQAIALNVGGNTITVRVIAESGTFKEYTIVVSRTAVNTNSNLSSLTISAGTLSPSFAVNTTAYSVSIPYVTTGIRVTPTVAGYNASVTVNGTAIVSGTQTGTIALSVGANTITIIVTAEDKSTRTYNITVTRADVNTNCNLAGLSISSGTLSPGFSPNTILYTAEIAYSVTSIRVTPTVAGYNATVKVNGTTISSGTASGAFSMSMGANAITIVVTAENGTTKTYTVTVNRIAASTNANLANLSISAGTLNPVFDQSIVSYNATVSHINANLTVTPTVAGLYATVKVNGTSVTSGTASGTINLSEGSNTITVSVTSESGAVKTYTITAHRQANDDYLSRLEVSQGAMPVFSPTINSYMVDVNETITAIRVKPTTYISSTSVTVNGVAVSSGTFSDEISLSPGKNIITVVVTSEDGGVNTYSLVIYRLNLFNFVVVSRNATTVIVKSDGTLWATGTNDDGQLGDGTTTNRFTPVQVMADVRYVSAGDYHTMILKTDGTLWATGYNGDGQLGDGTTTNRFTPVQVMTDVKYVSAGGYHTMIIKNDGTLWATGTNDDGQLGDSTYTGKKIPVKIMTDVKYVSAGGYHTMIIKNDGTLWATGDNGSGQLGDGATYTERTIPVQVMTDVKYVSAGGSHTMIIKNDGTLWGTGRNDNGELGDGTKTYRTTPVKIMTDVKHVSAGRNHTMIIKNDGTLWATGDNYWDQLGYGITDISTPVQIMTDVLQAYAGCITIIQKSDGTFWATGRTTGCGLFGDGSTDGSTYFIQLPW